MIAQVAFLLCFMGSYLISHAYAVRVSRALESSGRFRGRGTIVLWAGPLALVNFVVVVGACAALGISPVDSGSAETSGVVLSGVLLLPCAFGTGALAVAAVRALPARRRAGPHRKLNSILGMLANVLAQAAFPLMAVVFGGALILGLRENPPGDIGEWIEIAIVVPLAVWIAMFFGEWIHTAMGAYAERLRSPSTSSQVDGGWTLYLRPFDEEHRLFAGSLTLEQFLGVELRKRVGPLVALGNPTDRIAPEGAERRYCEDEEWQAAVESLALRAAGIVGVTGASASTAWELKRIRELGLEQRLFLVSPPPVEQVEPLPATAVQRSRPRRALSFGRRLFGAYIDDDTAKISRLVSFGRLPGAWSPSGLTSWSDFVSALAECGYAVSFEDPGPGAVLGFDPGGKAVVLARGVRTPAEYMQPIATSLAQHADDDVG